MAILVTGLVAKESVCLLTDLVVVIGSTTPLCTCHPPVPKLSTPNMPGDCWPHHDSPSCSHTPGDEGKRGGGLRITPTYPSFVLRPLLTWPRSPAAALDLPIWAAAPAVSPRVSTSPETQKRGEGDIKLPSPPCRDPRGHLPPSCMCERRHAPHICTCTCAGRCAPLCQTSCSQHHCWLPLRFHLDLQLRHHGQQLPLHVLMHPPLHVLMHLPLQSHLDSQLCCHGQHLPFVCLAHELLGAHAPAPEPLAVPAWATKAVAGSYPWVSA